MGYDKQFSNSIGIKEYSALRTPSFRKRSEGVVFCRLGGSLWVQEAVGELVELVVAVAAPLLVVVEVANHVGVGALPRGRPCVVVHIVHPVARIYSTLPPATTNNHASTARNKHINDFE